ncbi:two-component response regulator ORR24-like [Gossypium arboreum]|uniref:two-component response regulator ORR24-like n=1 Tax=Gossypium arboreum TaxID=29729 RepID=UPI00081925DF|nr:two-component response regulator ORR24-like [Gossypium arboreum]
MTLQEKRGGSNGEDGGKDRFPIGMHVLAVDDDPVCLKVLENLLRKCQYHVSTTNQATTALKMLRENRNRYDLVITGVNMPDMDAFKLLELVGLEMDLPVIMLSTHGDTELVMKGITHGACDYLLKPVRIEELKNIWQHVVRKNKPDFKDHINALNQDNGHEDEDRSIQEKPRVVWSDEVHRKFVSAVNELGLDKAVPKKVLDLMNVEGLKRETVASHLQKYRLYIGHSIVATLGSKDPSYLRMGPLGGFGYFHTLTGPGRISSASLPSYQPGGMFGRLNTSATLSLHGISSSVIQPGHCQTSNNPINGSGKIQPAVVPANQKKNGTLFQGIPTSVDLNQPSQNKPTNGCGEFNRVNDPNFQDARMAVGGSCNTLHVSSGNPLLLQSNTQQTKHSGAFGNQASLSNSILDLCSFKAKSANLEDSKGDISNVGLNNYIILNMDYATKQQRGDSRHDNNGNTNHSFCRADSLVPFLFVCFVLFCCVYKICQKTYDAWC